MYLCFHQNLLNQLIMTFSSAACATVPFTTKVPVHVSVCTLVSIALGLILKGRILESSDEHIIFATHTEFLSVEVI